MADPVDSMIQLGRCTSKSCPMQGSCGRYMSLTPKSDAPPTRIPKYGYVYGSEYLTEKCFCKCYGMQHDGTDGTPLSEQGNGVKDDVPKPAENVSPSLPTDSASSGQRAPPFNTFLGGATASVNKTPFEPGVSMYANIRKANGNGPPPRKSTGSKTKRIPQDSDDDAPAPKKSRVSSKSTTSSVKSKQKPAVPVQYTVVLVEDLTTLTNDMYETPKDAQLKVLRLNGHVHSVLLSPDDSKDEIDSKIRASFIAPGRLMDFNAQCMNGWRLWTSVPRGQGKTPLLQHCNTAPDIDYEQMTWASDKSRGADVKLYPNRIYISLCSGSLDLDVPMLRDIQKHHKGKKEKAENVSDDEDESDDDVEIVDERLNDDEEYKPLYHPDKNPNISENNRALLLRVSQLLGLLKTVSVALGGTGSSTVRL
ncbi:hypothetical protein C8J56DRAFT_1117721 [Mycena floridula]|nr:hypothetical protein C8J56DRAFT_1117721 [Mycena floridula]